MRVFGVLIIVIGIFVVYLGWQNKLWPAFQALLGKGVVPSTHANDPANGSQVSLGNGQTVAKQPDAVNAGGWSMGMGGGWTIGPNGQYYGN